MLAVDCFMATGLPETSHLMTTVAVVIAFVPWIAFLVPYVLNRYTPLESAASRAGNPTRRSHRA